jgi:hypothetical protein
VIADLADLQALLRACMALRDSHKALINVNLTSGKSYSQAQRMVMSKRVLPRLTMVTQRLREELSTGHARTLTVFAHFADAHRVSSQLSPTLGDDFEISSLPSFYSPIGRGSIDSATLRFSYPPCFDEPSLICENDGPFVRAEAVVRVPSPGVRGALEKHSASASPLRTPAARRCIRLRRD